MVSQPRRRHTPASQYLDALGRCSAVDRGRHQGRTCSLPGISYGLNRGAQQREGPRRSWTRPARVQPERRKRAVEQGFLSGQTRTPSRDATCSGTRPPIEPHPLGEPTRTRSDRSCMSLGAKRCSNPDLTRARRRGWRNPWVKRECSQGRPAKPLLHPTGPCPYSRRTSSAITSAPPVAK